MKNIYLDNLGKYKKYAVIGPVLKWLEAIFDLVMPLIIADIINVGIIEGNFSYILSRGAILAAFAIVGVIFAVTCQKCASIVAYEFGTNLRAALYSRICSFSPRELDRFSAEGLLTNVVSDTFQMQNGLGIAIRLLVRAPFLIVGAVIMSFTIDVTAGFIVLISSLVIMFVIIFIMGATKKRFLLNQKHIEELSRITFENMDGARVIKAFARQADEKHRFYKENEEYKKNAAISGTISALLSPLSVLLINTAIIFALYFGGVEVRIGGLAQGDVVAIVNYLNQILLAMFVIATTANIFVKAGVSYKRVEPVLNAHSSLIYGAREEEGKSEYAFELNDVDFSYTSSARVLKDVDLKIKRGTSLGIIGGTGSGKSALLNVLTRLYDADGEVLYMGNDIKSYSEKYLRSRFGIAMQGNTLFQGTVRSNLLIGKADASEEEMRFALEQSLAMFVYDKGGLDIPIIEGGKNFSGGERQRLIIARAIVTDAPVLFFDDSFSALDYITAKTVLSNIKKMDKTVIVISQRANIVKQTDEVIVMDKGRLVETGTSGEFFSAIEKSQREDV